MKEENEKTLKDIFGIDVINISREDKQLEEIIEKLLERDRYNNQYIRKLGDEIAATRRVLDIVAEEYILDRILIAKNEIRMERDEKEKIRDRKIV